MNELEIIKVLFHWLDDRKFPWQVANSFIYLWESDYWAMTQSGETREFEIKISRSDYFCDSKKEKHNGAKGANYFYYVTPKDLIKKEEVDKRYGLIYVSDGRLEIIRKPKRLHSNGFDNWKMLANKMYWKFRGLWREKWINKEISRDQYHEGFNLELLNSEQNVQVSDTTDDAQGTEAGQNKLKGE